MATVRSVDADNFGEVRHAVPLQFSRGRDASLLSHAQREPRHAAIGMSTRDAIAGCDLDRRDRISKQRPEGQMRDWDTLPNRREIPGDQSKYAEPDQSCREQPVSK